MVCSDVLAQEGDSVDSLKSLIDDLEKLKEQLQAVQDACGEEETRSTDRFTELHDWDLSAREYLNSRLRKITHEIVAESLEDQPRTYFGVVEALKRPERASGDNITHLDIGVTRSARIIPLLQMVNGDPALWRAANTLSQMGIHTLGELICYSPGNLRDLGLSHDQISKLDGICASVNHRLAPIDRDFSCDSKPMIEQALQT